MKSLKIYGPPGTGKTWTLLQHFERELKQAKPDKVGFVTFTRAARLEALSRASLPEAELPYVKTLHASCYKLLNTHQDELVMRDDIREFGKTIGVHLTGYMPDLFSLETTTEVYQQPTKADRLLQLNHLGRHRGLMLKETLKDAPQELDYKYAVWFTKAYREWKTANGKMDYTDLLTEYLSRGPTVDLDVLFVDEAQDLSWLQWQVVRKLSAGCQRLYICGDDDQTIFRFAGAHASLFNLEPADEVVVLPQSYRIPRAVHELSQRIIHRVRVRQEKEFRPRDVEGEVRPIGRLDISHLHAASTLVLFRNHHRGAALACQLEDLGIPFEGLNASLSSADIRGTLAGWDKISRHEPLQLTEARAVVASTVNGLLEDGATEKVKVATGEFSATALLRSAALQMPWWRVAAKLPRLSYLQRVVAKHGFAKALKPQINLLSIHQSKGREASTVVLDLELARRTYEGYMGAGVDDEHRVFYVGVTRAKDRLLTLLPSDSMHYQL